ncbi:MAG: amidohydrolase [Novosphingobium sp.]|uniref:amidohydrolase n=1 Tax=Novosphingobium sp. TaxID=1874826 RepID=UPI0012C43F9D|nr:amidohydrolase [Novosphingobium sp.]MPS70987.1 amidohydrolase [Novosphingobium sp.]
MTALNRRNFITRTAGAAAAGLFYRQAAWAQGVPVDTIYTNGRIWTGEGREIFTDAIGLVGSRVVALGAEATRSLADKRTRVVDLGGAFVTPGFTDCHVHFTMGSATIGQPSLREAHNREAFVKVIADAAKAMPAGEWLLGGNWDNDSWGGELPSRDWFDTVSQQTPVAVVRYDLHMIVLNSLALRMLNLGEDTPDVAGGVIVRDGKGRLTGVFKDAAKDMVIERIPRPTDAQIDATNRRGIQLALSKGVTQVHETGIDWNTFESARRMRAAGNLPFRFYAMTPLKDWQKLDAIIKAEGRGDEFVRWGGCKVVFDGSLGSRTALFYEPYLDDPKTRGITVTDPDEMRSLMQAADAAGLQIATHAIGDRANDMVLDFWAEVVKVNGPRDRRGRIEHAQHLNPASIGRFAEQGVIASVQPFHAVDDGRWAVRRIGPERLKTTYAFESLIRSGAHVSFGSDWPVAPIDPLTGLKAAVLRQTLDGANPNGWYPEQKVEIHDALLAYTRGAAFAGRSEADTGTLSPGRLADFVIWDRDLAAIDPADLDKAKVVSTHLGGTKVYG